MRSTIPLMVLALILTAGCGNKEPENIGVILDSIGRHPVNGKYVKALEVKKEDTGKLRLWVEGARSASSDDMDLGDGWFVYAETQTRIWVFNGDQTLKLFEYSGSPGNETITQDPHSVDEIPQEILARLPESLKQ